jgi:hypothetical protein
MYLEHSASVDGQPISGNSEGALRAGGVLLPVMGLEIWVHVEFRSCELTTTCISGVREVPHEV